MEGFAPLPFLIKMTAQEYKSNGYNVSLHLEQALIDRCEAMVYDAYIKPIVPNADKTTKQVKTAIMMLSFVMLCQQTITATCSGGRQKTDSTSSVNVDLTRQMHEVGKQAAVVIEALKQRIDAVKGADVFDFLGLFFKSNYFYL